MYCCLLAAFLLTQSAAMLRRWGKFLGIVSPEAAEPADTLYRRVRAFFVARGGLRCVAGLATAVGLVAAAEITLVSGWLFIDHHQHVTYLIECPAAESRGQPFIPSPICVVGHVAAHILLEQSGI